LPRRKLAGAPCRRWALDIESLRQILITGKLNPEKIETFGESLKEAGEGYLFLKSLEKAIPADEIVHKCHSVSKLADKLLNVLSLDARGGIEVNFLLEKFGIDSGKMYATVYELYAAANEAALFMRKGIQGSIIEVLQEYFEFDEQAIEKELEEENEDQVEITDEPQPQPDEYEVRRRVATAVLLSSLVASKRKHGQTAETKLFLGLRELFIHRGGSNALGSENLYKFVKACSMTFDEKIRIPSQPLFRDLLRKAMQSRALTGVPIE
jgi:hypothetical protein